MAIIKQSETFLKRFGSIRTTSCGKGLRTRILTTLRGLIVSVYLTYDLTYTLTLRGLIVSVYLTYDLTNTLTLKRVDSFSVSYL